jgi:molybdate/tungstate transport system substrate-binding protein
VITESGGRLQAGQLDAGFFYASEAKAGNIATVPLTGVDLKASYTISVLKGALNEKGAEAFVSYLLSPAGQAILTQDGFTLVSPAKLSGTGVPASLHSLFAG